MIYIPGISYHEVTHRPVVYTRHFLQLVSVSTPTSRSQNIRQQTNTVVVVNALFQGDVIHIPDLESPDHDIFAIQKQEAAVT